MAKQKSPCKCLRLCSPHSAYERRQRSLSQFVGEARRSAQSPSRPSNRTRPIIQIRPSRSIGVPVPRATHRSRIGPHESGLPELPQDRSVLFFDPILPLASISIGARSELNRTRKLMLGLVLPIPAYEAATRRPGGKQLVILECRSPYQDPIIENEPSMGGEPSLRFVDANSELRAMAISRKQMLECKRLGQASHPRYTP